MERKLNKKNIIIHKYGGTSISNSDRVKKVAKRILKLVNSGKKLVVVVSAQGDTTDRLISLARNLNNTPSDREMDMLLSTGEQVSTALMVMALTNLGVKAISKTGWQCGIVTDETHGAASILEIEKEKIENSLENYDVIVVAGFQGISKSQEITTLGRGGSDTTALVLAAGLGIGMCDIYTDVTGVFSADPRIVEDARKLEDISYNEMLELASEGARIMDGRAVSFAKKYDIAIHVRTYFNDETGTIIRKEAILEKRTVKGVSHKSDVSKVTLVGVPKTAQALCTIFEKISDENINIDAIIQSDSTRDITNVSFTLLKQDLLRVVKLLQDLSKELSITDVQYEVDCARVSIIGEGMKLKHGIAAKLFQALSEREIAVYMTTTSDTNISVIIDLERVEEAIKVIHKKFNLSLEEK